MKLRVVPTLASPEDLSEPVRHRGLRLKPVGIAGVITIAVALALSSFLIARASLRYSAANHTLAQARATLESRQHFIDGWTRDQAVKPEAVDRIQERLAHLLDAEPRLPSGLVYVPRKDKKLDTTEFMQRLQADEKKQATDGAPAAMDVEMRGDLHRVVAVLQEIRQDGAWVSVDQVYVDRAHPPRVRMTLTTRGAE